MTAAIRVLLVDDHAVVREGYRRLLEEDERIVVAGEAEDAATAYALYRELAPDVVVMDVSLRASSGIVAVRHILARDARARILIFSMHEDAIFVTHALRAGALGYITKSSAPEILTAAVLVVAGGRRYLGADVAHALEPEALDAARRRFDALSSRELEVLRLFLAGWSADAVAKALHLSRKSVSNQRWAIKQKTGVDNFLQLVPAALQAGLITATPDRARLAAAGLATQRE